MMAQATHPQSTTTLPLAMARRLWRAFSLGRVFSALMLLGMLVPQTSHLDSVLTNFSWFLGGLYLILTCAAWLLLRNHPPGQQWGLAWVATLALEVGIISLVQLLQLWQPGGTLHFSPLLALPILAAACLGNLRMALATTASVTLLLLGGYALAALDGLPNGWELTVQVATVCAGYFAVAFLTHHLAQRLGWQERLARRHHRLARSQEEINTLIIDRLTEGVLVVDSSLHIQQANPAACQLLGGDCKPPMALNQRPAWQPLGELVLQALSTGQSQDARLQLVEANLPPVGLYVRVWPSDHSTDDGLQGSEHPFLSEDSQYTAPATQFLVFLEDLRQLEARLRTEKMAAMGRMSAAVAHEIRNPLAAISQANALLAEDITDPAQQRLVHMVAANAQRIAHTIEDVLDIARVQQQIQHSPSIGLALDEVVSTIWREWQAQDSAQRQGRCHLDCPGSVAFDGEHLRRIIVNLLDNAQRYAQPDASGHKQLWLGTGRQRNGRAWVQVWSSGPEIEASMQNHLFEPFFSSHSRSSGLGLFICRELCQRHGASLRYHRQACPGQPEGPAGNAFTLRFAHSSPAARGETGALFTASD